MAPTLSQINPSTRRGAAARCRNFCLNRCCRQEQHARLICTFLHTKGNDTLHGPTDTRTSSHQRRCRETAVSEKQQGAAECKPAAERLSSTTRFRRICNGVDGAASLDVLSAAFVCPSSFGPPDPAPNASEQGLRNLCPPIVFVGLSLDRRASFERPHRSRTGADPKIGRRAPRQPLSGPFARQTGRGARSRTASLSPCGPRR